jgi:hypothetical protein
MEELYQKLLHNNKGSKFITRRMKKVEYARSVFLNVRRPHIKNEIGYKAGDKHNSSVNTRCQEFIKFTKGNIQYEKK